LDASSTYAFSNYLISGLSLESVGGSFALSLSDILFIYIVIKFMLYIFFLS